ncbi:alcohol acetyltransferase [Aminipila butyrica]|uniref:alcohol acetyltransferase n=1 Tax=Aminipila butyrica TaxID=433296 RepID=UPI001A9B5EEA|nr:alcohol acetyltransferase [Aminipila butyrica]
MIGMKRLYGLDNTAKLYPAVTKNANTCVFRLSAILTENVDHHALQQAAEITIKRFHTMAVKLKQGFFWVYLYENSNPLVVQKESNYPCGPIMGIKENNEYLFKIMYLDRRITLECFHTLTDGMGAMEFLKSLVYQYLLLIGKDVQDEGIILLPESVPDQQEEEDGCLRYYQKHVKKSKFETRKARAIKGTVLANPRTNVIHGVISSLPLKNYVHHQGTTITGYLTTVFAQAISSSASQQGQSHHPIRIGIPVNLRGLFPSKTLRNFVSQISVSLPAASEQTFDEQMNSVTTQMKSSITKENLSGRINTFVGYEKMLAGRILPWFIKKAAIDFVSKRSNRATTALLSNLGNIKLPQSMAQYIDMIEVVPSPKKAASITCGICSVGGKLNISFASNIVESDVIELFFHLISEQTGLDVEIYSNGWIETDTLPADGRIRYPAYAAAETKPPQISFKPPSRLLHELIPIRWI